MKNYQKISGFIATARCIKRDAKWGSALYCDCGCQIPRNTDPDIDLAGLTVTRRSLHGYADYILSRDGQEVGALNTQYCTIALDGNYYRGVDASHLDQLIAQAHKIPYIQRRDSVGDTLEDTAATVALMDKIDAQEALANDSTLCPLCHSYCWGDCTANI